MRGDMLSIPYRYSLSRPQAKAYAGGFFDYNDGRKLSANPFPKKGKQAWAWTDGWNDAAALAAMRRGMSTEEWSRYEYEQLQARDRRRGR